MVRRMNGETNHAAPPGQSMWRPAGWGFPRKLTAIILRLRSPIRIACTGHVPAEHRGRRCVGQAHPVEDIAARAEFVDGPSDHHSIRRPRGTADHSEGSQKLPRDHYLPHLHAPRPYDKIQRWISDTIKVRR